MASASLQYLDRAVGQLRELGRVPDPLNVETSYLAVAQDFSDQIVKDSTDNLIIGTNEEILGAVEFGKQRFARLIEEGSSLPLRVSD